MTETIRAGGLRVRYDSAAFELADSAPPPATAPRRSGRTAAVPTPVVGEGAGTRRSILAALSANDLTLVDSMELKPRLEATPPTGRRRAGAPAVAPQQSIFEIDVGAGEQAVMLYEQDGVYRWGLPDSTALAPVLAAAPATARTVRFTLDLQPERRPRPPGRRGLVGDLLFAAVKTWVFKFAVKAGVQLGIRLLERNVRPGPVIVDDAADPTHWPRPADLTKVKLPQHRAPRILLLGHGTFTNTVASFSPLCATPWGQELLGAALAHYDLVLGFDHRTLSDDPQANAVDLFDALCGLRCAAPPVLDAIGYSRGGLVIRSLMEAILPVSQKWRAVPGKCVFVGVPNAGTSLAEPDNWQQLADLYVNLAAATATALALFPATAAAGAFLESAVGGVAALVKAIAGQTIGDGGVAGLKAMEPGGPFVTTLNQLQPGQLGPKEASYFAVTSDFEVRLLQDGTHEPKELPRRLALLLVDEAADQLMKGPNDLVVDTASMVAIDLAAGDFVKDRLDFGKNPEVHHLAYLAHPRVASALARWLALPAPGRSHIAQPGVEVAPPLRADVDTDFVEVDASAQGAEAKALIEKKKPSYVVVRRPMGTATAHYAYRTEEVLGALGKAAPADRMFDVMDLHEEDASRVDAGGASPPPSPYLHFAPPPGPAPAPAPAPARRFPSARRSVLLRDRRVAGVRPEPGGAFKLDEAVSAISGDGARLELAVGRQRAMPTFDAPSAPRVRAARTSGKKKEPVAGACYFQASTEQQVKVGTTATVDVTLSREALQAAAGRAASGGSAAVAAGEKLIVNVVPKVNFSCEGTAREEVVAPLPGQPRTLLFELTATDVGPGEIWVVVRQGALALVVLKLFPEVVAGAPARLPRESAGVPAALPTRILQPPNTLTIYDQRNGNELRFRFELSSAQLGVMDVFESKPIAGERDAFVAGIYKRIEETWTDNATEKKDFLEELRAIGADLWSELVPDPLQRALWDARDRIKSVLVISEEPFVPWELLHLKEPGKALGQDWRFLGQMGCVRWLHGCGFPPSTIEVASGRARYVIPDYADPDYALPATATERAFLEAKFGAKAIAAEPTAVRAAIGKPGGLDLLHFAGHGQADGANIGHAQILLQAEKVDGKSKVSYLTATTVQGFANLAATGPDGNRPVVVLNACQVGRLGFKLTSIGGFAPAFLRGGAGLFVSPLWSVGDEPASLFILKLYEELRARKSLAEAVTSARKAAMDGDEATWIAYAVYGNPELTLKR